MEDFGHLIVHGVSQMNVFFITVGIFSFVRIVISNKDLFERCGTEPMATILTRRRWRWIGHVTLQEASIAKSAMHWTPEGKRKRGRPKITLRRTVEKEIEEMGKTWEGIKFMTKDRQMWREYVAALHAS